MKGIKFAVQNARLLSLPNEAAYSIVEQSVHASPDVCASTVHLAAPLANLTLMKKLGEGANGKVFLAQDARDGRLVALKAVNRAQSVRLEKMADVFAERSIMKQLTACGDGAKRFVGLEETFADRYNLYFVTVRGLQHLIHHRILMSFMIQELIPGGDLFSEIVRWNALLPVYRVRFIMVDIVRFPLSFLHVSSSDAHARPSASSSPSTACICSASGTST